MNKEEKEFFYSIGRGSLNLNGKFYYGLDYSITDFMNSLEQENKKYKEVIDKAIEYLNNNWSGGYTDATLKYKVEEIKITELLEILKGDSNE